MEEMIMFYQEAASAGSLTITIAFVFPFVCAFIALLAVLNREWCKNHIKHLTFVFISLCILTMMIGNWHTQILFKNEMLPKLRYQIQNYRLLVEKYDKIFNTLTVYIEENKDNSTKFRYIIKNQTEHFSKTKHLWGERHDIMLRKIKNR